MTKYKNENSKKDKYMKTRNICLAVLMASMTTSLSAQVIINVDANNQGSCFQREHS